MRFLPPRSHPVGLRWDVDGIRSGGAGAVAGGAGLQPRDGPRGRLLPQRPRGAPRRLPPTAAPPARPAHTPSGFSAISSLVVCRGALRVRSTVPAMATKVQVRDRAPQYEGMVVVTIPLEGMCPPSFAFPRRVGSAAPVQRGQAAGWGHRIQRARVLRGRRLRHPHRGHGGGGPGSLSRREGKSTSIAHTIPHQ